MVQNTDVLIFILPKINFGPAQNTKLHVNLLCQLVQTTGGPQIQNTDGDRATSVLCFPVSDFQYKIQALPQLGRPEADYYRRWGGEEGGIVPPVVKDENKK